MYQPWLVSHPNGRSDKDSLFGGPGEMLSRSHALTPRDVLWCHYSAGIFCKRAAGEGAMTLNDWLGRGYFLAVDEGRYRPQKLTRFNVRLAHLVTQTIFFVGLSDDRCTKGASLKRDATPRTNSSFQSAYASGNRPITFRKWNCIMNYRPN